MDIDEKVQPPGTALGIEEMFRTAGPLLWRSVYAFTGGRRDVTEEAGAEAFARALAHAERIRDPVAWIYRTAHRLAARELRGERRTPPEARQAGPADDPRLDGVLSLRRLPPRQRAAVVLHYQADLPVTEIAAPAGTPATGPPGPRPVVASQIALPLSIRPHPWRRPRFRTDAPRGRLFREGHLLLLDSGPMRASRDGPDPQTSTPFRFDRDV